jgi:hypothetical protein
VSESANAIGSPSGEVNFAAGLVHHVSRWLNLNIVEIEAKFQVTYLQIVEENAQLGARISFVVRFGENSRLRASACVVVAVVTANLHLHHCSIVGMCTFRNFYGLNWSVIVTLANKKLTWLTQFPPGILMSSSVSMSYNCQPKPATVRKYNLKFCNKIV